MDTVLCRKGRDTPVSSKEVVEGYPCLLPSVCINSEFREVCNGRTNRCDPHSLHVCPHIFYPSQFYASKSTTTRIPSSSVMVNLFFLQDSITANWLRISEKKKKNRQNNDWPSNKLRTYRTHRSWRRHRKW